MKLFYIQGTGKIYGEDGKITPYPVNKLVLQNKKGDETEIKIDKITKKVLPYMFNIVPDGSHTEDENGVECEVFTLNED